MPWPIPRLAFTLTNNGREILRAPLAKDLRERAYQIFGAEFLENLLEVDGGHPQVVRVRGYVSAPRDRRTSRDAQYLFVNGRFVRDRLISRALSEGYRAILPHGVYPGRPSFFGDAARRSGRQRSPGKNRSTISAQCRSRGRRSRSCARRAGQRRLRSCGGLLEPPLGAQASSLLSLRREPQLRYK